MEEEPESKPPNWDAVMSRGKLPQTAVKENREVISALMGTLPPPWEWQMRREAVSLTSADMQAYSGFNQTRIRNWEEGNGVRNPSLWLEYARVLVKVTDYIMETGEAPPPLTEKYARRVKKPEGVSFSNEDAAAQAQAVRGMLISVDDWLLRGDYAKYPDADLEALSELFSKLHGAAQKAGNHLKKEQRGRKERAHGR